MTGRAWSDVEQHLLDLTGQMLKAISAQDWAAYAALCDASLSCFEPEARGHLVEGVEFHQFYFGLPAAAGRISTIASPHVRVVGDIGIVSYVRLIQLLDGDGRPVTKTAEETRVWQRRSDGWRMVHLHRSNPG